MKKVKTFTTYRDCIIEQGIYKGFEWHHPDTQDCEWDNDNWHCVGQGSSETIQDCKEQIDEYLNNL